MKRILLFISFSVTTLLSGCGLLMLTQYTPPTNGPTATLFLADTLYVRTAYFQNPYTCTGSANMPFQPTVFSNDKAIVTHIPANKLITLHSYAYNYDTFNCPDVVYSFIPRTNQLYQVNYVKSKQPFLKSLIENPSCHLRLTNLTTGKAVPFTVRHYRGGLLGKTLCNDSLAK